MAACMAVFHCWEPGRPVLGVNTLTAFERKSKKGLVSRDGLSDLAAVKGPFLSLALTEMVGVRGRVGVRGLGRAGVAEETA